ncbi:pyridoxamine phosphate oxidase family protein [Paramyrothecium foliicola]|nr:pyridoxamine phosphate oxidase family protein [Paramyrothecium foliicola]
MKLYSSLSDDLAQWAQRQPIFFTGSAPTHGAHINVSPKGLTDSHFAVLGPNQCAYIDRTGSGCETISHAYENGRLCLMFTSFGPSPRIMRLFCRASVVEWDQPQFNSLVRQIAKGKREAFDGARAVIVCDIWQVQTSCGYGVPRVKQSFYALKDDDAENADEAIRQKDDAATDELVVFEERPTLDRHAVSYAGEKKMVAYHKKVNFDSLDGLPGLISARRAVGQRLWLVDIQTKLQRLWAEREAMAFGALLAVLLYFIYNWVWGVRVIVFRWPHEPSETVSA